MMTFDVCPRCNREWGVWEDHKYSDPPYCKHCDLVLYDNPKEIRMGAEKLMVECSSFWWHIFDHRCSIVRINGGVIGLPWLPYTVDKETLMKYMVLL